MKICKIENCGRNHFGKGFCNMHYGRNRKGIDLYAPVRTTELHGKSQSPEYITWMHMVQRCTNQNDKSYKNYGGRGITVCERWLHSFNAFFEDMGEQPSKSHSIDRINNSLGYTKENCRWATATMQMMNRRSWGKSGHAGVFASGTRWRVIFKKHHIGSYPSVPKALEAYKSAKQEYLERQTNV